MAAELTDRMDFIAQADECRPAVRSPLYDFFKRAADIVLSLIASVIIMLPCLIIALLIKIEDGGSVIYAHTRTGKDGKPFKVYKFRSMKPDADSIDKYMSPEQQNKYMEEYKLKDDPRVTRIGRFIRKTSLDELPQIFMNVLFMGNMSLVGPRPILEEETRRYGNARNALLSVKPGLTGYWAAYADSSTSYSDGSRQLMELYYVHNRSLTLDIRIIFKTVLTVIRKAKK